MLDEAGYGEDQHADEDENYFISMTDMMVGVLFIFIILLMVFALNFRSQTDTTDEQIRRLKQAEATADVVATRLDALQRTIDEDITAIKTAENVRSQLLHEIKDELEKKNLVVAVDDVNGVLHLRDAAISFAPDQYVLDARDLRNVGIISHVLMQVLPKYMSETKNRAAFLETVFIEGHTDQTGQRDHNWDLSGQRAVQTYLGLTSAEPGLLTLRNRASQQVFSVSGYADTRPVPGTSVKEYDKQRRIDLRFVMDVDNKKRLDEMNSLTEEMKGQLTDLRRAVDKARGTIPDTANGN